MHESAPSLSSNSGRNLVVSSVNLSGTSLSWNNLTSFFISFLYSSAAWSNTDYTIVKSLFLHLMCTSASMNLINPYSQILLCSHYYLHNEILKKFFVCSNVTLLFIDDLMFGLLIQFLYQLINSLHLLDSCCVFLCRSLNFKLDFILLKLCIVVLD